MQKQILITNIQRFSLHDGPGIRTTVFLKGCSIRCPWCSNPENLVAEPQSYSKDGVIGTYGCYYDLDTLVYECLKDKGFYDGEINNQSQWRISSVSELEKLPGGVTFSGGECLLQMEMLSHICKSLHDQGVHIAVETSLFVPTQNLMLAINHIDIFYVYIKMLDIVKVRNVEKGNLRQYLTNLHFLLTWNDEQGRGMPVVIRIPVIGHYTDDDFNRKAVHDLLAMYKDRILKVELIKEHNLGESKYKSLGMEFSYYGIDDGLMEQYKEELSDLDTPVEICKI